MSATPRAGHISGTFGVARLRITEPETIVFKRKPKAQNIADLDELKPMLSSGRPVLIDFFQVGCAPCQVMDGIVNELARDYGDTAHIVKAWDGYPVRPRHSRSDRHPPPC